MTQIVMHLKGSLESNFHAVVYSSSKMTYFKPYSQEESES